ncbi:MAG: hypothetical protein HY982_02220 [Candidatus Magasanikbacteria bacterium]|nr:hypothetical protein [Candidatus Magasanikbacteria bacterium]
MRRAVSEEELSLFLKKLIKKHPPTKGRGVRHPRLISLRQVAVNPPTFEATIKQKTSLHESYLKFMENSLRANFDFSGAPLVIYVRKIKSF